MGMGRAATRQSTICLTVGMQVLLYPGKHISHAASESYQLLDLFVAIDRKKFDTFQWHGKKTWARKKNTSNCNVRRLLDNGTLLDLHRMSRTKDLFEGLHRIIKTTNAALQVFKFTKKHSSPDLASRGIRCNWNVFFTLTYLFWRDNSVNVST